MGLRSYIENAKQKSNQEKTVMALGLSLVVTSAIFSLWLFNFKTIIANEKPASTDAAKGESPFAGVGDSIFQGVDRVKAGWGVVSGETAKITEEIQNYSSGTNSTTTQ